MDFCVFVSFAQFWALYKGARFDQGQPGAVSVTGRVKAGSTLPTTSASVDVRHMGVQVTLEDLCLLPASSTMPVSVSARPRTYNHAYISDIHASFSSFGAVVIRVQRV